MTIQVTCPSGHKIKAPDSAAGKRVKCPSCGQPFEIPAIQSAGGGPVPRVKASGGEDADADPLGLGNVPIASDDPLGLGDAGSLSDPLGMGEGNLMASSFTSPAMSPQNAPLPTAFAAQQSAGPKGTNKPSQKQGSGKMMLIIGIAAGAGILLVGFVALMIVLLTAGGKDNIADRSNLSKEGNNGDSVRAGDGSNGDSSAVDQQPPVANVGGGSDGIPALVLGPDTNRPIFILTPTDTPSIVSSAPLSAESDLAAPPWKHELLAGERIELSFKPHIINARAAPLGSYSFVLDERGERLAVVGKDRIAVIGLPDLNVQVEIGLTNPPNLVAIADEFLILGHEDGSILEIVDLKSRESVKKFKTLKDCTLMWLEVRKNRLICDWYHSKTNTTCSGILDLESMTVPALVSHVAAHVRGNDEILPASTDSWHLNGIVLDAKLQQLNALPTATIFNVAVLPDGWFTTPNNQDANHGPPEKYFNRLENGVLISIKETDDPPAKETDMPREFSIMYRYVNPERPDGGYPAKLFPIFRTIRLYMHMHAAGNFVVFQPHDRKQDLGVYYFDTRKLDPPPVVPKHPGGLPKEIVVEKSPLELTSGGISTMTFTVADRFNAVSCNLDMGPLIDLNGVADVKLDGSRITVELSNAKLSALLQENLAQLKCLGGLRRNILEIKENKFRKNITDEEVVDWYTPNAVNAYERLTGNKATGVPVIVKLRLITKVTSASGTDEKPLIYDHQLFWMVSRQDALKLTKFSNVD